LIGYFVPRDKIAEFKTHVPDGVRAADTHISGIDSLKKKEADEDEKKAPYISCGLLTLPNAHGKTAEDEKVDWERINNSPQADLLVQTYKEIYKDRSPPLQTLHAWQGKSVGDVSYAIYYVSPTVVAAEYPNDDQNYTNGQSIVMWYRHGPFTILLPGDITPEMLKKILDDEEGVQKRFSPIGKDAAKGGTAYKETGTQLSVDFAYPAIGRGVAARAGASECLRG